MRIRHRAKGHLLAIALLATAAVAFLVLLSVISRRKTV
jgi:hypothetical protein